MKTANIHVYGNIAVYMYIKYCTFCLKIDYTLRCLVYNGVQYLHHKDATGCCAFRSLNLEDNDKCTLNYYMYICMFKTLVSCTLPCLISTAVIGNYLTDSNISYCILDTYF